MTDDDKNNSSDNTALISLAERASADMERIGAQLGLVPHDAPSDIEQDIDEHALVQAFEQASNLPRLRPPSNVRERQAIGEAIARHLCSARDGEDCDIAVLRVVANLGPAEAIAAADALAKWSLALRAAADKALARGLR